MTLPPMTNPEIFFGTLTLTGFFAFAATLACAQFITSRKG